MVAEAMTETTLGEDTRSGILVSQVGKERVQVRKAHSLIRQVYDPRNLARAWGAGEGQPRRWWGGPGQY